MPYWFNIRTGKVEAHEDPGRAQGGDLMGPYETEAEAADALETARKRTEAWDEEDRREREWETGDPDSNTWDNNPFNG
ncbi:methionine aminopeptidase [Ornithinimicrobium sp. F0845]|uniref:methionine aminopeptidase n=1 Tax=Ornithinimicrobium sp. F0845 TaxID=2926412 RepID=UPI001FF2BA31|nr:methionine aminopeptidase [Ornithinimicrobium sp. F0845]MCK0114085.1 methionine aminopeptidase [Ornithinimicrobium sp. F0845]